MTALPLALTMGDPAGIGPDVTLMAYAQRAAFTLPPFVVHGDVELYRQRASLLGVSVDIIPCTPADAVTTFDLGLPVVPLEHVVDSKAGQPNVAAAEATIGSIVAAAGDVRAGRTSAMITNPIAKSVLYDAGFAHPGHTEFLGELAHKLWGERVRPVMMLACEELRVVPTTIHIPIKDVPATLTPALLRETLNVVLRGLRYDFGIDSPRIACAGLNPHAGEDGTIGTEDKDIILPVIAEFQRDGHAVTGPVPGDTLFHAAARANYDCVVAMYHDQALIPIKTLAFDRGVNVTLGLPFVRTSPDHGTAFDIAGTGRANPRSLIEAISLADRMARLRMRGSVS